MLRAAAAGDSNAVNQLLPVVYEELRAVAEAQLRHERTGHTHQPTALVHEAYVRLVGDRGLEWNDRVHFLALAARSMRQILVNHALARRAAKRGGGAQRIELDDAVALFEQRSPDLVALDEALGTLATLDPRQAKLVELRFFGGLSVEDAANVLGLTKRTAEREWATARAWLRREVSNV
jgi:RNA polymerase sigma-70 factor, ECF subfamily